MLSQAVPPALEVWCAVPIILDDEPRALTNRADAKTKCSPAPSFKRRVRIETRRGQLATQVEHGSMTVRANAFGFAAVRAEERGADRKLARIVVGDYFPG